MVSSDERYAIEQESAGRWFLLDEAHRDELGLARTSGPFATLAETRLGAIDVVPMMSGRWEDLVQRAARVWAFGQEVLVASIADQLAALTVARRDKDRARVEARRLRQRDGPVPQTPG
jgi:hypothetical protein